jgi:hypothetical protein
VIVIRCGMVATFGGMWRSDGQDAAMLASVAPLARVRFPNQAMCCV